MSYQVSLKRRLFSTSTLSSLINKRGEVAIDINKNTLVIFDGVTSGGIPLALESHTHPDVTSSTDGFMSAGDYVALQGLLSITDATESVHGYMSVTDKIKLDGIPTGGGGGIPPTSSSDIPNALVLRDGSGNFSAGTITATSFVGNLTGNASTVTNGVVTTGSYSDPSWITTLSGSKITGSLSLATIPWGGITGAPTNVSAFTNDAGYITGSASITGSSGSVSGQTSSPTPSTVMVRDSFGRSQVVTPAAANDIANKAYVDANSGVVVYCPQPPLPLFTNPSGVFSQYIANISSQAGLIKSISIINGNYTTMFLEFTIDGNTPVSVSLGSYWQFPNTIIGNSTIILKLDIQYKSSIAIRCYSTTSFLTGEVSIQVWNWSQIT